MKLTTLKKMLAAVCAAGSAVAFADVYTVKSGETLTVTDATVGGYADGIAFEDATGVVEFNTTAAPTMDITGAGTVKKTSASDWTMSKAISNFTGDYVLQGGGIVQVTSNTKGYFGKDATDVGCLYIKDGNTLDVINIKDASWGTWTILDQRVAHIEGTGKDGAGAIRTCYRYSTEGIVKRIVCDADATFNLKDGYYINNNGGYFDVQEHTLTIVGKGSLCLVGAAGQVRGSGRILLLRTNNNSPTLTLRETNQRLYPGSTTVLEISNKTTLQMQATGLSTLVCAYDGAVRFTGATATFNVGDQYSDKKYSIWSVTNSMSLAGPVTIGTAQEPTVVTMWSALKTYPLTILGNISGTGSIRTSSSANDYGRVQLMGDNTYTGYTYIDNISTRPGHFLAYKPTSLPNYASVTCSYNNVSVALNDEGTLWTPAKIAELANQATFLNGAWVGLDTTWATDTVEVALSDDLTLGSAYVGGVGPHDIEFAAPRATPVNLAAAGAVTRVKGPGTFKVGGIHVSEAVPTNKTSLLEFTDGVKAESCDKPMLIGWQEQTDHGLARMRISNATFVNTNLNPSVYDQSYRDAIVVGHNVNGILEIGEGAVVSNRLLVGGSYFGTAGSVFQTGGSMTALGAQETSDIYGKMCVQLGHLNDLGGSANGHVNMGYYELTGGELTVCGPFIVGNNNIGYFYQDGGTARVVPAIGSSAVPSLAVGKGNGYGGALTVKAGTFTSPGGWSFCEGNGNSHSLLTVNGPTAVLDLRNGWANSICGANDTMIACINLLNGGTFRTWGFRRGLNGTKTKNFGTFTVNFDGGVFEPTSPGNDFLAYAASDNPLYFPNHVYVYSKGAVVDTSICTNKFAVTYVPIEAAGGNGVLSIPWTDTTTVRAFRPIVKIVGDGMGATAEAEYDSVNHVITGIRVLTPGVGYTTATAQLLNYRNNVLASVACEVGAYESTGGFTKRGANALHLGGTNTWKGATVVEGGTLKALGDWAIPKGTAVVLAGGDLDFNNKTGEVASVTYGAGGGQILNAASVKLPETAEMAISAEDIANGKKVEMTGDVDLSKFSLSVSGDGSGLAQNARYTIATTTGGTFSGTLGGVTMDPSLAKWKVKVYPTKITMSIPRGMVIMVY